MRRFRIAFIVLCLVPISIFSQTENNTNQKKKTFKIANLALQYMEAYSNWDSHKMKTFYSDSIHFKDPTALEIFGPQYDALGKENVANVFKNVFPEKLPDYINFKVKDYFESGTYVVINSDFEFVLPKAWYGDKASGKIFVSVPLVTILRFKDEKISSHQDFVDYNSYRKQISLQLKDIKKK